MFGVALTWSFQSGFLLDQLHNRLGNEEGFIAVSDIYQALLDQNIEPKLAIVGDPEFIQMVLAKGKIKVPVIRCLGG